MLTASRCRRLIAACFALALVPFLVSASPKTPNNKITIVGSGVELVDADGSSSQKIEKVVEKQSSRAEELRDRLNKPISFKGSGLNPEDEVELEAILTWTAERYDLNFVFDRRVFEDIKVAYPEKTVIKLEPLLKIRDVKIKDIVRYLLSKIVCDRYVTYVIIDNAIVITTEEMATYRWMRQPVSVDCDKEKISLALRRLALETATNLVVDPRAEGESQKLVTVQVNNAPLEEVVYIMAEMADLKPVRVGTILFLTTKEKAAEMRADPERKHLVGPYPLPPNENVPPLP